MSKNLCNKRMKIDNPYEIWVSHDGRWEHRVLKKYQNEENEKANCYARWFVAVKSPFTHGTFELGDSYVRDIKESANKVSDMYKFLKKGK